MGKRVVSISIVVMLVVFLCGDLVKLVAKEQKTELEDYKNALQAILQWEKECYEVSAEESLLKECLTMEAGASGMDWNAFGIARSGKKEDYAAYGAMIKSNYEFAQKDTSTMEAYEITDLERMVLVLHALGQLEPNTEDEMIKQIQARLEEPQELNGIIWALLAVDASGKKKYNSIREDCVEKLLDTQRKDGSFALTEDSDDGDVDITAMALQALAPYYKGSIEDKRLQKKKRYVEQAVDKGLEWLAKQQCEDGGFGSMGEENAESTAQVLIALCCLEINPREMESFKKGQNDVLDALWSYQMDNGGFLHTKELAKADPMASQQVYIAFTAYLRYLEGKSSIYDMKKEVENGAKGKFVSVFSEDSISITTEITKEDIQKMKSLPEEISLEQYVDVVVLLERMEQAKNTKDYEKEQRVLLERLKLMNHKRKMISAMNKTIMEELFPFENLSVEQKSVAQSVKRKLQQLDDYEKAMVLNYDEILAYEDKNGSEQYDWMRVSLIISGALVGIGGFICLRKYVHK